MIIRWEFKPPLLDYALDLVSNGRIRIVLADEVSLSQATSAYELLESRAVTGRIVLNLGNNIRNIPHAHERIL